MSVDLTPFRGKGWTPALSVKAFSKDGANIYFLQYQPSSALFYDKAERESWIKSNAAAKELGYKINYYAAGKYGNVYVYEKDGKALTVDEFKELANESKREPEKVEIKTKSMIKYAYKAGDKVIFFHTASEVVKGVIKVVSNMSNGSYVWNTNKGYVAENNMLPDIVSAKKEETSGSGYKAFKGLGGSGATGCYIVEFADGKEVRVRTDERNDAIQLAMRSRFNNNDYPKTINVEEEIIEPIKEEQSIPFKDVKEGDYVSVYYGVQKSPDKKVDEGLVTFKYANKYLTLDNDNERKYNFSNAYYIEKKPTKIKTEPIQKNMIKTIKGRTRKLMLPNGEEHTAVYAIVDLNDIKASHNEVTFSNTEGYPTVNGRNINDRNYKDDVSAQNNVRKIAENLEPETLISLSSTPSGTPIINKDGIVVSGNNRVMSLKLAKHDYPKKYDAYKKQIKEDSEIFGILNVFDEKDFNEYKKEAQEWLDSGKVNIRYKRITSGFNKGGRKAFISNYEEIFPQMEFTESFDNDGVKNPEDTYTLQTRIKNNIANYLYRIDNNKAKIQNPVLVRIDESLPDKLTTEVLAAYNQETKKGERPVDKAIKLASILNDNERVRNSIISIIDGYDTFSDLYSSEGRSDRKKLIEIFVQSGLIPEAQLPVFFDNGEFTEGGKDYIETLLSAIILTPDALKVIGIDGVRKYRQTIIGSLPVLITNKNLKGGASLSSDISDAVIIQYKVVQAGGDFSDYTHSQSLFSEDKPKEKPLFMNALLRVGKNTFKQSIKRYNDAVKDNEGASLFGETLSVEEIFDKTIKANVDKEDKKLIEQLYPKQDLTKKSENIPTFDAIKQENKDMNNVIGTTKSGKEVLQKFDSAPRDWDKQDYLDAAKINSEYAKKTKDVSLKELALDYAISFQSKAAMESMSDVFVKKDIKKGKLKISDIPESVKTFMPLIQQKAIVGSEEHWDVIDSLEKIINEMPKTYGTDGVKAAEKVIYLHYFYNGSNWYVVKKDMEREQLQAYGYVILNGDTQNAEWGYINIEELKKTNKVELDFFFEPIKFGELFSEDNEEDGYDDIEEEDFGAKLLFEQVIGKWKHKVTFNNFAEMVYISSFNVEYPTATNYTQYQYKQFLPDNNEYINPEKLKKEIAKYLNKLSVVFRQMVMSNEHNDKKEAETKTETGYKFLLDKSGYDYDLVVSFNDSEEKIMVAYRYKKNLLKYYSFGYDEIESNESTILNNNIDVINLKKDIIAELKKESPVFIENNKEDDYDGIEEDIENEHEILKNEMPEKQLISDIKLLCHESFNGYDFLVTFSDLKKQIIINAFHLKTGSRDFDTYNYDEISNATNIEHKLKNDILFILGNESKVFGKEANIKSENKQLDPAKPEQATAPAKEFKYYKGVNNAYKNAYELNRAIEELLDTKESGFTSEEKVFMSSYSGYGGLDKLGSFSDTELKTILYEYYTPRKVVEKMWGLAYKHGFKGGSIIEPASGIGEFIRLAPDKTLVTGYEINPYSAKIAKILYPETTIINAAFETLFIKNNASIKNKIQGLKKYSLVIGNPPYGKFGGKYAGMGEDNYTKAENYIEYFITRGLDLLESGGLLIMIIGAEVANGASTFLQKGISKTKKEIMNKAILVDAYRLPNGVFERTDVLSDIIVLRKK